MKEKKDFLIYYYICYFIPLLFFIPTAWANSQIGISFDPRPNEPPACPINIYPSDGATDIEVPVTLQVSVYDESSSTVDVYFYNALDNTSIGADYDVSADWSTATVIWSGLQYETNYSWYVVANDSEYENTSQTWTFTTESSYTPSPSPTYTYYRGGVRMISPTISDIYHEPARVTSYDPVYVYANVTDDYIVKSVTLYWNDGSDHSKSMILQDGNIYYAQIGPFPDGLTVTYSIEATDYCGASHTIRSGTKSFTVVAGPVIEIVIENISSGEMRKIPVGKLDGVDIDSIHFTPTIDLTNVKITIEKLVDIPENITATSIETKIVYTFIDIKFTADNESIGKDEIKSLVIIFKVNLTWIAENNIDKETIASMAYDNNEWQNLTTTILFEDETYVYCKIETNDTSIFVIVADEVIEPPGPGEENSILLILFMAITATLMPVLILKSKRRRRQIYYYMRNKLNNVHNIELKVDELLSRLDNKNNKEIKKEKPRNHRNPREKPEQSLRKRK
jgi:PGF-pre-PGF domain-containing protein